MHEPPSLVRTGLTVLWAFVMASVVWLRVSSLYNDGVAGAANPLLPDGLWLEAFARSIVVRHDLAGQSYREAINSMVLHSGLLIVVALVAGTPWRSVRWRAAAAAYVAAFFFVIQVVGVTAYALLLRASLSGGVAWGDVSIGFAIFWALTPLALGGLWAYRFWLPAFRGATVPSGERKVSP